MEETKLGSNILTNDPSMTGWGWVVVNSKTHSVVHCGCIKTKKENKIRRIRKGDDDVRRVSEINNVLLNVIRDYNVKMILTELPHGSQNASGATMMGRVQGIMQTISDCLNIPIEWYSEGDAKKCLLGRQSASKKEIIDAIAVRYDMSRAYSRIKYKDEAVADAMAIYNVARSQSSTLKLIM